MELPFVKNSDTSRVAAAGARSNAATQRQRVLNLLRGEGPFTDEQMQEILHLSGSTQRPRRVELVEAGLVRNSGQTRSTRSGRDAVLWEAVRE